MKLLLLRVGRGRTAWADDAAADYLGRVRRHIPIEEILLAPARVGRHPGESDIALAREDERRRLMAESASGDRRVVLDERGQMLSTADLSKFLEKLASGSCRRVVFQIGGPYGHAPGSLEGADLVLALSAMVLNHELARVVLLEQLYRVACLWHGEPYAH